MISALLLEYYWIPVKTGLTDGYVYPSTSKDTEVAEMLPPEWQKVADFQEFLPDSLKSGRNVRYLPLFNQGRTSFITYSFCCRNRGEVALLRSGYF